MDGVTTRTLMGAAYPQPGLYAKFFDVDMDPLVQVVQDTVGRHDTFGLACTRPLLRGHGLPRPRELHATTSTGRSRRTASPSAPGWEAVNFFFNTHVDERQRARLRRAVVAPRRLRADAGDDRSRVRVIRVPRRHRPGQRLGHHRHPRARLLAREPLLDGHRPPRDPGGRASADQGNGVPPAYEQAHRELRGLPRLLATPVLQHRGRHQPVLGVPREGRDHGPLAAAQVGGARPGRRDPDPDGDHARRAPAGGRAGGLHGRLQRDRRHDRRRHRVPARRQQLPLHRRRPVHGRVAEGAGGAARPEGVGEALDRPAPQRGGPGPREPRDHEEAGLDAADPAGARGPEVVPLPGGADRRLPGHPGGGLAHGLHGRARLRGVLPPGRRSGGLGRDLGGRAAARHDAARASTRST